MMKLDLHVHTVLSRDSAIPVHRNVAKVLRRRGLDGAAITDHDRLDNVARLSRILEREGMIAVPGEEVKTEGGGEILCYFITETIPRGTWEEVIDAVRSQGGIAVLAHPFDYIRGNWMRWLVRDARTPGNVLSRVDGLETFNARNYSPGGNRIARDLASKSGKIAIAGSDAHNLFELGCAWTGIEEPVSSTEDVLVAIRRGRVSACRSEHLPWVPLPGRGARRACGAVVKKAFSGLNSTLPGFKHWRAARDATPFNGKRGKTRS